LCSVRCEIASFPTHEVETKQKVGICTTRRHVIHPLQRPAAFGMLSSLPLHVPLHSHGGRPTPCLHAARNGQAPAADIDLAINGHRLLGASIRDAEQGDKAGGHLKTERNKIERSETKDLLQVCLLSGWLPTCDVIRA
jgi:hypothetical protein